MTLNVQNRELVVPGDLLAAGDYLLGDGTYRKGDEVYANILGLVDNKEKFIKIIPLSGKYSPKAKDLVIGIVEDMAFSHWYIDINTMASGVLTVANGTERFVDLNEEDLSDIYGIGDVVVAKIENISATGSAGLTMKDRGLFKLKDGRLISVNPTKVPRVIGKKGTMVQLLKNLSGCKVIVGQNGRVWVSGENTDLVIEAVRLIEREAHTSGLTDKIKEFLEAKTGNKVSENGTGLSKSTVEALEARKAMLEAKKAEAAMSAEPEATIDMSPEPAAESAATTEVN
ncbi:MAG: exosome complex RNA-binding protein Rrp4 [archaeon]